MRNKIFLIGNLKSSYMTQYIENVLEPLGFDIYMQVSDEIKELRNSFISEHRINLIKNYDIKDSKIFRIHFLGWRLRTILNSVEVRKIQNINFIHVQFVEKIDLLKVHFSKFRDTKCYASFWGSDLLRMSKKYLKQEEKYLRNYNLISADGYTLQNAYNKIFPKLNVRFEMVPYGVSLFPFIDKYIDDVNACKSFFCFPLNKKIIAIGYNAIKQQQHDKVLAELDKIENKTEYFLVFQMTYGISDGNYVPNLLNQIEKSGFEYKVFQERLSMDDLAKLRIATDIFINAQTTDAFANSFIENIYTKSQIINAKWLHYPELDMFPLYVNEFSDFNEIPSLLEKRIDDEKLEWNKKCIENRTWENCRKQWAKAYGVEYKE